MKRIDTGQLYFAMFASSALLFFVATCISLSWVQSLHNSDTLLVSLISIDHYTPFYWGQNRLGQLFPLLVSSIGNYSANLFAQTELQVCSTLGSIVLFNLYFLHQGLARTQRLAAATIAMIFTLCIFASNVQTVGILALAGQPYMPSLFLVLLAVAILFRIKVRMTVCIAACFSSLLIAFWINLSSAILAIGLILCVDLSINLSTSLQASRTNFEIDHAHLQIRRRLAALLALSIALGVNVWFARRYPGPSYLIFDQVDLWISGLQRLTASVVNYYFVPIRLVAFSALLLVIAVFQVARREISKQYSVRDLMAFVAVCVGFAVIAAGNEWVRLNLYDPRYWAIPVMLLVFVATGWVSSVIVRLLSDGVGLRRTLIASQIVLVGVSVVFLGFPLIVPPNPA
jgi:hypothetical protein